MRLIKSKNLSRLIKGSTILLIGSTLINILNYIFQVTMGRMLTQEDYGIFNALNSLLFLFLVSSAALQNGFVPYVAKYKAIGKIEKLTTITDKLTRIITWGSITVFLLILLLSPQIGKFLQIEDITPIILLDGVFLVTTLLTLNRSVLQGLQKFTKYTLNLTIEVVIKLILGITLVYFGLQVNGAIGAIVLAMAITYVFSHKEIKKTLKKGTAEKDIKIKRVHWNYMIRVFITMLCLAGFYNIDVILVKHYLSPTEAGLYGAVAVIGKIIFFGTAIINQVLLPLAAETHEKKQDSRKLLWYSLLFVSISAACAISIYYIWPEFIINLLYGEEYKSIAPELGYFAIFISLYSILNVIATYLLSLKHHRYLPVLIIGIILQTTLIAFWNQNIHDIITASIITMVVVIFGCLASLPKKQTHTTV